MSRVFLYAPHPDDETLSMGLAMVYYLANGVDVHLVSMNSGAALGVANTLNGVTGCSVPADHPYTHSPAREGYEPLDVADTASARVLEARGALGAAAMIPPTGSTRGAVFHHIADLPEGFGGAAHGPPTAAGIAAAKTVIQGFVDSYPNSFHYTMTDAEALTGMAADGGTGHPDHAACGVALRQLKKSTAIAPNSGGLTYAQALTGARFFVSRLYWASSRPDQKYPAPLLTVASGSLAWFNSGSRYSEYAAWLRSQVIRPYKAWNPATGTYGLGWHQVPSQFNANFGSAVSIANLWHA